ncbi:MAG: hypothetical protein Q6351_004700 [Candidatus Njordarchaeum guaymaensis]
MRKRAIPVIMAIMTILILPTSILLSGGTINSKIGEFPVQIEKGNQSTPDQNQLLLKTAQTGYEGIYVEGPRMTQTSSIPADWFDTTWKYRVAVWVNETYGIYRPTQLITIQLNFPENQCLNNTIIVVDNSTDPAEIIPAQIWGETYYPSSNYYSSVYISWITSLNPYEKKLFYVYWNDRDTGYTYQFTNDRNKFLVYSETNGRYYIENKYFESTIQVNGGISISVNGQELAGDSSLFYLPSVTYPSNATYIWLDSITMANYSGYAGVRDHMKIVAWYDDTSIKIYGYNRSTGEWTLLADTVINSNEMFRYPPSGESYYNLTRVESNKPVSIFVTDLGSTQPNSYGVDHDSDDAFYSYFGTDIVLWVPRDLFITAYFNDTEVTVTDLSEGDDSFQFTLNSGEVWFHGMGDTRTYFSSYPYSYYDNNENSGPSFFENDIVRVKANKPITIVGGYISNDFFGMIKGYEYKKYVFPFFSRFNIVPLYNDTNVNVTLKYYDRQEQDFEIYKQYSLLLDANETYEVSDDPKNITLVIAVDLYKNNTKQVNNLYKFNVTIFIFNETARRYGQTPYYVKYITYTGSVTNTSAPGYHYNNPTSGNWNETVVTLPGGKSYWIVLGWNTNDYLNLYLYWNGTSPLQDGDGDDFIFAYWGERRRSDFDTNSYWGGKLANTYEVYVYYSTPIKSAVTPSGGQDRPYRNELLHEEWGLAIVETDKPVLIYTGTGYWGYEGTDASTWYGGQYLYCGKVFDLAFPFQNRYVKIAALEPNTYVHFYLNGSSADWRLRNVYYDEVTQGGDSVFLRDVTSWADVPLPRNTRIHIEADKPIVIKVMGGWTSDWRWDYYSGEYSWPEPGHYNPIYSTGSRAYFAYEELSLLVLDPRPPIVSVSKIVEGPILTKYSVSWGVEHNMIVSDTFTFIANSSSFIVERTIYTPQYISYSNYITILGVDLSNYWSTVTAIQNITLYPYTSVLRGDYLDHEMINLVNKNYIMAFYEEVNNYGLAIGLVSLSVNGYSNIVQNLTLSGLVIEVNEYRAYSSAYIDLAGGESNSIEAKYAITAGVFGSNIISVSKSDALAFMYPIVIDKRAPESTTIDVHVIVKDLDGNGIPNADITLSSSGQNVNLASKTDTNGRVVFFDVPASNDYEISLSWTNSSSLFLEFPSAQRTNTSLSITGDTVFEYTLHVKDVYVNVLTAEHEVFENNYVLNLTGIYYYGVSLSEIIINSTHTEFITNYLLLDNLPVGHMPLDRIEYNITITYQSAYGVSTSNETKFIWDSSNTTNSVTIVMSVSDLYIRAIDKNGVELPGAITYLFVGSVNYSRLTNSSGIAKFDYLPHGTYHIDAEYYGIKNASNVIIEFNATKVFNISIPVQYGTKSAYISLSQETYEGYWGSTVAVYAQFIDSLTNEPVPANLTLWVMDRFTGEVIESGRMFNVTETLYVYEIVLSGRIKAGQTYLIQVNGYSSGYTKPAPANATLSVIPIPMVVDYPEKVENYWGRSVIIWVNVTRTEDFLYEPISDAIVRAKITKESIQYRYLGLEESVSLPGYYAYNLSLQGNLSVGVYAIEIEIDKLGYSNVTIRYSLSILQVPTILTANASSLDVYYTEKINIELDLIRADIQTGVENSNINWELLDQNNNVVASDTAVELGNGEYKVTIDTSTLEIQTYLLSITSTKPNYQTSKVSISISVKPIPTLAYTSKTSETVEYGLSTTINITYYDNLHKVRVTADEANITIMDSDGERVYTSILEANETGIYLVKINTTKLGLVPDVYTITVKLNKPYYVNRTLTITLTVTIIRTVSFVQPANITLYWGESGQSIIYWNRTRDGLYIEADTIDLNVTDLETGNRVTKGVKVEFKDGVYVISVDSSELMDGHTYAVEVQLEKTYHESTKITVYVKVMSIPTSVVATPLVANITWGDDFNFSVSVINLLNGSGVDVSIQMTVLVGGNPINVGDAITIISLGDGQYVVLVKSGMLVSNQYYVIKLTLMKPHYDLPAIELTAGIQPVSVDVSIKTSGTVLKNPATGVATSTVEITLRDSTTGAPISDAKVYVIVRLGTEVIFNITAQETEPGVYVATIDWSGVEPGDYSVSVEVKSITRHGYSASTSIAASVSPAATGVRVDYLGGSTVIAGRRYPNLIIYPVIITIFLVVGFVGYKYYSWFKLPIEVREVIQLIKNIQKDRYVYEAPSREDVFREIISSQLGIE